MSNIVICPWFAAFRKGRIGLGLSMLVMQLTLVLWPVAIRWAREHAHQCQVQALLDQISVNYAYQPYEKHAPVSPGGSDTRAPGVFV